MATNFPCECLVVVPTTEREAAMPAELMRNAAVWAQGWFSRSVLRSAQFPKEAPVVLCFFPAADKQAAEFVRQLSNGFRSAVWRHRRVELS